MRTTVLGLFAVVSLVVLSGAGAITFGRPDVNNEYPNVASVRGIVEAENLARISCSGSLLHRDAQKVVILTAAHCTDGWSGAIAAGTIDSVGVSFDQNNQVGGDDHERDLLRQGRGSDQLPREGRAVREVRLRAGRLLRECRKCPRPDGLRALGRAHTCSSGSNHRVLVGSDRWGERSHASAFVYGSRLWNR